LLKAAPFPDVEIHVAADPSAGCKQKNQYRLVEVEKKCKFIVFVLLLKINYN